MEELAEVIAIENNQISLVSQVKSSCNSCSQAETCASGQVAKAIPHKKLSFMLTYPQHLSSKIHIGDRVILSLPEGDVLQSAWQVYLLPILGLVTFSALGQLLLNQQFLTHELQALMFGMTGGYLGYRLAKYLQNKPDRINSLQPKILRVLAHQKSDGINANLEDMYNKM
ncbi:MAG: SoxR reducing system RseC family protein [Colwellia sp.]|nr:SoxR reducing system RseC family protein [Colwellia sp.]